MLVCLGQNTIERCLYAIFVGKVMDYGSAGIKIENDL